jgi:hypothetical protein
MADVNTWFQLVAKGVMGHAICHHATTLDSVLCAESE